jgi:hypothetical protein
MSHWRVFVMVVGVLAVSSVGLAWLPSALHDHPDRLSTLMDRQQPKAATPGVTINDAMRTIRALEALSLKRHEQLVEDTQALADAYDGLVQQNADRIAEIAALKKELLAIRAELAVLKTSR